MKRKILAAFLVVMLVGCADTPMKTDVVYVDKLVPVDIPEPPIMVRPELDIFKLTPEQLMDEGELVKSYKITVKQLQGYAEQLEKILDGYRKKSNLSVNTDTAEEVPK